MEDSQQGTVVTVLHIPQHSSKQPNIRKAGETLGTPISFQKGVLILVE
jgi:hypothetical protein